MAFESIAPAPEVSRSGPGWSQADTFVLPGGYAVDGAVHREVEVTHRAVVVRHDRHAAGARGHRDNPARSLGERLRDHGAHVAPGQAVDLRGPLGPAVLDR